MTAAPEPTSPSPIAVRSVLYGDDSVAAIAARLREPGALDENGPWSALTAGATRLFGGQLASVADGFLDVDLGHVVVAGWRTHQQLQDAAKATAATPGLRTVVDLATHTVSGSWRPRVEVVVGSARAYLTFELDIAFQLTALAASVAAGRLVALGGGDGTVSAWFAIGGHELGRKTVGYDVRQSIPLGSGIPLLGSRQPVDVTGQSPPPLSGAGILTP